MICFIYEGEKNNHDKRLHDCEFNCKTRISYIEVSRWEIYGIVLKIIVQAQVHIIQKLVFGQ